MAILGGSPLGLIGVTSNPIGGYSTFNGGKTRNVAVNSYNKSQGYSLLSGRRRLRAWPDIKQYTGTYPVGDDNKSFTEYDTSGLTTVDYDAMRTSGGKIGDNYTQKTLHNNDVYDTSVLNIIEKLAGTKAALRPADFAYLKNLGVYPNNRLMIARRFASPSEPNIMVKDKGLGSLASIITWFNNEEDIFTITFGEKWDEAKADFTGILNSIGEDFGRKSESMGLGDLLGKAMGAVPLPGFTEIFQREFLKGIGLLDEGASAGIPAGNPNLIKSARARQTVGYGAAGSGLSAKLSFKFESEYELKFISGIDPTMVWMDIVGMALRFGTSESSNYGLSKKFSAKIKRWIANPNNVLSEMIVSIRKTLTVVKDEVGKKIHAVWEEATKKAEELAQSDETGGEEPGDLEKVLAKKVAKASRKLLDKLVNVGDDILAGTILKYRTEVLGIVNALTGAPSTPWHVTIGNPLRPIFCSGDMYTQDVSLSFGPQLAFNDLPSSIKISFTLENARDLGMQEIMARFNSGYLRTVDVQKTFYETEQKIDKDGKLTFDAIGQFGYEGAAAEQKPETKSIPPQSNPDSKVADAKTADPTKTDAGKTDSAKTDPGKVAATNAGATGNTGNGATKTEEQKKGTSKTEGGKEAKVKVNKNPKKAQAKK
jgi:hypothetical protein